MNWDPHCHFHHLTGGMQARLEAIACMPWKTDLRPLLPKSLLIQCHSLPGFSNVTRTSRGMSGTNPSRSPTNRPLRP